ncbi:phage tail assembly protein [Brevundimonas vitis]|uniref:Phage tail assembly protein n=1 Tax=Brevundimonas vitisensis TaxID=2800818 RepID=A0ABX7BJK2_9CAUL|nr:phage tail assembly protein [Brevundimonas vitisensis]QQQ17741.1 phage tail assembly protein [Brevundimonas vitisensis]
MTIQGLKKTFPLKHPFDFGGEQITEVALRRPKGREVREMQNAGAGKNGDVGFAMMAALAEREEALFDEMDGEDVMVVQVWLNGILGN